MPSLRLLVVDDDRDFAHTLADILESRGHRVTIAHDGESAIKLFDTQHFDLCFMDISLPGRNGVDCFLEIRKTRSSAPVIIMTGFGLEELVARAIAGGARTVLHKPLDFERVLAMVKEVAPKGVVLVVDDDRDFAESVADVLNGAGYSALVAREGGEALDEMRARQPDVVVLDLRLPDMDGLHVYREMRRSGLAMPAVAVTGFGQDESDAVELFKSLSVTVLTKPLDIQRLLEVVEEAAAKGAKRA